MVKSKNQRKNYSSKKRRNNKNLINPTKKIILGVIAVASLVVVVGLIVALLFNNENMVKSKISALANDYYENYFYKNLTSSEKFKQIKDLDTAMEKYHTNGLSPVTLRNLLLYDDQKNIEFRDYLTKYCDENATTVKFYMDPPYDQKSYRAEITYACNF